MAKQTSRSNLRYQYNEMIWHDSRGKIVRHPRYQEKPNSLDGKVFLNGYLRFVRDGKSLNDYMQVHGKFTARQVQVQARRLRKLYEGATGETFPLLRKVSRIVDTNEKVNDTTWIASAVKKAGVGAHKNGKKISIRKKAGKKR